MTGNEWHDGIPKEPGWYRILLEGEEITEGKLWQCQLNCKWWWILPDGVRVPPEDVQWSGEKIRS